MSAYPTVQQLRDWLEVAATQVDDEQLAEILESEIVNQSRVCRIPVDAADPPAPAPAPDQVRAIYRRVGREIVARGLSAGFMSAGAEYGTTTLASWDSEVERLEGPTRVFVVGGPRRVMCAPSWEWMR